MDAYKSTIELADRYYAGDKALCTELACRELIKVTDEKE
jgi:hypothetical protein